MCLRVVLEARDPCVFSLLVYRTSDLALSVSYIAPAPDSAWYDGYIIQQSVLICVVRPDMVVRKCIAHALGI